MQVFKGALKKAIKEYQKKYGVSNFRTLVVTDADIQKDQEYFLTFSSVSYLSILNFFDFFLQFPISPFRNCFDLFLDKKQNIFGPI